MTNQIIAEPRARSKPRHERRPIAPKLRFAVFQRDSFTCQYCGAVAPDVTLHCDHIEPVSKGGANHLENLITACVDCNIGKGAKRLLSENERDIRALINKGYPRVTAPLLRKLKPIASILIERFGDDPDGDFMDELLNLHGYGVDCFTMTYCAKITPTARDFWDDAIECDNMAGGVVSGAH